MGLAGILTNVETQFHTAEALHPVSAAHCEAEKETKEWDRLPLTAQSVFLAARYHRNLHSDLAVPHNPHFPQHEECDVCRQDTER